MCLAYKEYVKSTIFLNIYPSRPVYCLFFVTTVHILLRSVICRLKQTAAFNAVFENFEFEKCFKVVNMIRTHACIMYTRVRKSNVTRFNVFPTAVSSRAIKSNLSVIMLNFCPQVSRKKTHRESCSIVTARRIIAYRIFQYT